MTLKHQKTKKRKMEFQRKITAKISRQRMPKSNNAMHKTRRSVWKQARANASFKHMYVPGFPEPFENFEANGVNHVQDYFACHWLNKLRLNKKPLIGNMGFPPKQWLPRARTSALLKSREGKKAVLEKTPTGKPRQTELWKCQLIFDETWFKFFSISRKNFRPYSWYYSNLEESRCSRSATLT